MLLVSTCAAARVTKPASGTFTREQLVKSAKIYFRDSTEFPMTQNMTFTISDSVGRVRQVKKQSVAYVFNGYSSGKQSASGKVRGEVSWWAKMRGSKMFKASVNSVFWTWIPGIRLYSKTEDYEFEAQEPR